jgi:spore germination protein YaaH
MEGDIAAHLAQTNLTTLALFSVTPAADGSMATKERGYRAIEGGLGRRLVREAHERGTRVELTFTSFGADRNRAFFEDEALQAAWIRTLVAYVEARGFDGVDVDVEALPIDLVPAYGSFVGRLGEALRAADPKAQVSVATGAHALGAAMAAAAAGAGADRIFLMGYDYRTAGSEPGATAPLQRLDGEGGDLTSSLDLYEALGVPVTRTILGLPLYGMTWPTVSADEGAAAAGSGEVWVPRRNLRSFADPSFIPTLVPLESVEFVGIASGNTFSAVYYDSPRSLRPKLALADERGLAGAGFWAVGYERGAAGYTDLINDFRAGRVAP